MIKKLIFLGISLHLNPSRGGIYGTISAATSGSDESRAWPAWSAMTNALEPPLARNAAASSAGRASRGWPSGAAASALVTAATCACKVASSRARAVTMARQPTAKAAVPIARTSTRPSRQAKRRASHHVGWVTRARGADSRHRAAYAPPHVHRHLPVCAAAGAPAPRRHWSQVSCRNRTDLARSTHA